jgi:hypothetical protein
MLAVSRRGLLASAAATAAFGLNKKLTFVSPAHAETPLEPTTGVYKYKVGSIEVTAVYDGIWRKPHDPTFIKNASVEETKAALAKAGLTTEFMPHGSREWTNPQEHKIERSRMLSCSPAAYCSHGSLSTRVCS